MSSGFPMNRAEWKAALDALPATPENIPAFFFSHGSPMLAMPAPDPRFGATSKSQGPNGTLANFLRDFGPALLEKYKPKGIVVFSAHWETSGERLVTDYGDENPLLYDYYGFQPELYELGFKSKGNRALSERVASLFSQAGYLARLTPKTEPRGRDGRGFNGPGLDHGVFVPFRIMFGEEYTDIPIVEASIDASMTPDGNWKIGQAVTALRREGILVLSGGLPIHNLRDFNSFSEETANDLQKAFHQATMEAASKEKNEDRKEALFKLPSHAGFRQAHPREDHFVPVYIAAGAGEDGGVKVLNGNYGIPTFAFGV